MAAARTHLHAPLDAVTIPTEKGTAHVRFSTRADGDLNADTVGHDDLALRWAALASGAHGVTWLDEVHGTRVVLVDEPGGQRHAEADAAVTSTPGCALGIWVGDCVPIALVSDEGVIGAAHAGWRGLLAGVVAETVAALRVEGARTITAVVGPSIHAECYEFGPDELGVIADRFGPSVRATTAKGTQALDMPAAVRAALSELDVSLAPYEAACTGCDERYWSHRARGDAERHGMVVWVAP